MQWVAYCQSIENDIVKNYENDIVKNKAKIAEQQKRPRELEQKIVEEENLEIVRIPESLCKWYN